MTKPLCYCASLCKSVYADKDSPAPKCDYCLGLRKEVAQATPARGE